MVKAAYRDASKIEAELQLLLDRSDEQLAPIGDPLRADLGLNRWLRNDREEAYSDWFEWVLQHLESKELVGLFHVQGDDVVEFCHQHSFRTTREQIIPDGRLDIVVIFGDGVDTANQAVLVIEVKVTSAEEAATEKQRVYCDWLEKHRCRHKPRPVLIAVEAERDDYAGFMLVSWSEICITLRKMLPYLSSRLGLTKTAMIAAFIGAVESNLLHLTVPGDPRRGHSLFYVRTVEHLKASMISTE